MNNKLEKILKGNGRGITKKIDKELLSELISLTFFLPENYPIGSRIYCVKNNVRKTPSCTCGTLLTYRSGKFTKTCGNKKCVKEFNKKTNLKKYGVDHNFKAKLIIEKSKQTKLKRYGDANYNNRDKAEKTCIEKYNTINPFQSTEVKTKIKNTMNEKYGKDSYLSTKEYSVQMKKKWLEKRIKQLDSLIGKKNYRIIDEETIEYICPFCNKKSNLNIGFLKLRINRYDIDICTHCNPVYKRESGEQIKLQNWVNTLRVQIETNYVLKDKKEIDIFIPKNKFGIEFNGLFWHSEIHKNRNYHLEKTKQANLEGIQLIHIWEDDWKYKKDIVKSIIKNKLGLSNKIYARKTTIKEVNNKDAKDFLNLNHLQGYIPSSIKIGLYYENEMMSLMTFGKRNGQHELLRFATKINYSVIGGASKLFKYFLNTYDVKHLISYASLDISEGSLYEQLKFKLVGETAPGYWWSRGDKKYNRVIFQKHKLVATGKDPLLTENEIMHKDGFFKIYNTGNLKYEYENRIYK